MTTTPDDALLETIVTVLEEHRRVLSSCRCGWASEPMLSKDHRRHVAEKLLVATLLATSQVHGEHVAAVNDRARLRTEALERQLEDCQKHLLST